MVGWCDVSILVRLFIGKHFRHSLSREEKTQIKKNIFSILYLARRTVFFSPLWISWTVALQYYDSSCHCSSEFSPFQQPLHYRWYAFLQKESHGALSSCPSYYCCCSCSSSFRRPSPLLHSSNSFSFCYNYHCRCCGDRCWQHFRPLSLILSFSLTLLHGGIIVVAVLSIVRLCAVFFFSLVSLCGGVWRLP